VTFHNNFTTDNNQSMSSNDKRLFSTSSSAQQLTNNMAFNNSFFPQQRRLPEYQQLPVMPFWTNRIFWLVSAIWNTIKFESEIQIHFVEKKKIYYHI
jgi:hypothetical protein